MNERKRPRPAPVDQPVIVAEREVTRGMDGDGVVHHDGAFFDRADARIATCGC